VDEEIQEILEEAFQRARGLLQQYRDELDQIVDLLLQEEEIPGEKVTRILEGAVVAPEGEAAFIGREMEPERRAAPAPGTVEE
jgi:hypothetical protein